MNFPARNELTVGARIHNNQPVESQVISGRSARPGDPTFTQNFGATQNTFARATTYMENQDHYSKPRTAHFEYAGATSNTLAGGTGLPKDSRGDGFAMTAALANRAKQDSAMNVRDSYQTGGNASVRGGGSQLNRSNVH